MATIKKAQSGAKVKSPTYKNLRMGVANQSKAEGRDYTEKATKQDSINYKRGFARGLKKDKETRWDIDEVEKVGRWEGINTKKNGGPIKKAQNGIKQPSAMETLNKAKKSLSKKVMDRVSKITSKSLSKAKNGKSFPDLNKDGKVTKADVLKGRGVIAKKGASIKKAQTGSNIKPYEKSVKTSKQVGVKGNDLFRIDSAGKVIEKAITPQQKIDLKSKQTKDSTSTMNSRNRMDESAKRFGRGMKTGGAVKKCKYGCK